MSELPFRAVSHLLQAPEDVLSQRPLLVGLKRGAALRLLQSRLPLHQPAALPLQEEFGFLDGGIMGGDVALEAVEGEKRRSEL